MALGGLSGFDPFSSGQVNPANGGANGAQNGEQVSLREQQEQLREQQRLEQQEAVATQREEERQQQLRSDVASGVVDPTSVRPGSLLNVVV